jgi:hypothetical protein
MLTCSTGSNIAKSIVMNCADLPRFTITLNYTTKVVNYLVSQLKEFLKI